MNKIMTLEDDVSMPAAPALPAIAGASAPQSESAPVYILRNRSCTCGRCPECQNRQSMHMASAPAPVINLTFNPSVAVNPNITANGGNATSEGSTATSEGSTATSPNGFSSVLGMAPGTHGSDRYASSLPGTPSQTPQTRPTPNVTPIAGATGWGTPLPNTAAPAQPGAPTPTPTTNTERIIERPVFIDRIKEVVRKVFEPMFMPVDRTVTKTVGRIEPVPVRHDVDRYVAEPVPVRRDVPVDRTVPVAVRPTTAPTPRPPQPYQVAKNKKDQVTDINYFA